MMTQKAQTVELLMPAELELPIGMPPSGTATPFRPDWREKRSHAFALNENSTARRSLRLSLWGHEVDVYANANLSIYSAQTCNARCPFCVEELRPASRGGELVQQKTFETNDDRYFSNLERTLDALKPLNPSVSITGGEPSLDPRLPRILRTLEAHGARKRTLTTNGSGLLREIEGRTVLDWIVSTGVQHLNISVAHPDPRRNARLMVLPEALSLEQLAEVTRHAREAGTRVRLSGVLTRESLETLEDLEQYLAFAQSLGVDNVIFRQLMKVDPDRVLPNAVTRFSERSRVLLTPLLTQITQASQSGQRPFRFVHQVMGYYYYVEVWQYLPPQGPPVDVVFEEADLAQLETVKRMDRERSQREQIHELIFHPNARLCSTWQPWDGILGPLSPPLPPHAAR